MCVLFIFFCVTKAFIKSKTGSIVEKIFAALTSKDFCYPKYMESTCKPKKRQTAVENRTKDINSSEKKHRQPIILDRQGNVNYNNQQITRLLKSVGEIRQVDALVVFGGAFCARFQKQFGNVCPSLKCL